MAAVETRTTFRAMYFLLAVLAVAALAGAPLLALDHVRTVTVTKPAAKLSSSSTAADARGQYDGKAQQIDGQQIGLPAGVVCDAFELADGVTLVCYQGGAS